MSARVSHYDLHCHSTRSDGSMAPGAVIARAARRGVKAIALTDHDELSGLAEARIAAAAAAIELIDGVEISVTWDDDTLHVVGLRVDPLNETLIEALRVNRSGRNERAERIAAQLERVGIAGALEGARAYVTNPELVSRTHFARFLVDTGRGRNTQAVFERFLGEGRPGYVPHVWASLGDAVNRINAAGGFAVIAHPGRYKLSEARREKLLRAFVDLGGTGIEVVTGSHSPDEFGYWARRAREFGLLGSVGSDFHGLQGCRDLGDLPPLPPGCAPVWDKF